MVYLCAPAGYGKTVAVRQWLDGDSRARAELSLDEYDNDPLHFCERFCAVLQDCQPRNDVLAEIVSHPAFGGAPDEFAVRAASALSVRENSVLIVDDLHFITDGQVLRLLLILLRRLPENFQIVLVSRHDLPPGFSDLWMKNRLTRITSENLLFTKEEIVQLYQKRGNSITRRQVDEIYRFTGGWAIGINALLLAGGEPMTGRLDYLEQFIRENVWEKWDESTRDFMLRTAAARELHPRLCTALTGVSDSGKLLDKLMRSGAFIFQSNDGIYHYHHLFQGFLRHMLEERGDEILFRLLEKEGQWYLERQDFYSAVDCFIRCGNHDGIAQCFDLLESSDRNEFVIEKMLPVIVNPKIRAAAESYPFLFLLMSWAAFAMGRSGDMTAYVDQYYTRYPEIAARNPELAHNILFLRILDYRATLGELTESVAALPVSPSSKGSQGSILMNMPLLHRSTRDFSELAGQNTEAAVEGLILTVGWLFGQETGLLRESLMAGLLYEQGHLEKAHVHALAANAEIKRHFSPELKFCAMATLVCVLDALEQSSEAKRLIEWIESMIEQDRAYYLYRNFNALLVRRRLWDGDIHAAREWISTHGAALYDNTTLYGIYMMFATCRAYIAIGDYDLAIILLTKVLELALTCRRPLDAIEARILLSISYWKKKRGFQKEALRHLEDAVFIAYPYGYTQIFVNEGAELHGMLGRLQRRAEQNDKMPSASFIKVLYLRTLEKQGGGLTSGQTEHPVKYTDKQKMVMKLLCEGKRYREMAEIMGIKIPTLRSHISLIYKKLGVTNETDAVIKIKSWNILDEI